jgi:pantoate--beta-alanine ligase
MQRIRKARPLRGLLQEWRAERLAIAFCPTMGNLHAGHLALVQRARQLADRVVVSIFVNPTQFVAGEDLARYPRTLEQDSLLLSEAGVDLLFAPEAAEIYPHDPATAAQCGVPALDGRLCGASRPGHFTGVATVVAKLFHLVGPDLALFGEKDFQQLLLIERLVADLFFPVQIVRVPTVREADGLALSSRNGYLSPAERAVAPRLYGILREVAAAVAARAPTARPPLAEASRPSQGLALDLGATQGEGAAAHRIPLGLPAGATLAEIEARGLAALAEAGFRPDYLRCLRRADLAEPSEADTDLQCLAAAWLGTTRLIDNLPAHR